MGEAGLVSIGPGSRACLSSRWRSSSRRHDQPTRPMLPPTFGLSCLCSKPTTCFQDPSLRFGEKLASLQNRRNVCLPPSLASLCCLVSLRVGSRFVSK